MERHMTPRGEIDVMTRSETLQRRRDNIARALRSARAHLRVNKHDRIALGVRREYLRSARLVGR